MASDLSERIDRALGAVRALERKLATDRVLARADAAFNEADHPRASDGKFGSGGGSAKLSPKQKAYISSYTGDDALKVNGDLRAGKEPTPQVKSIDEALAKSTLPPGTKLFRGMDKEAAIKFLGSRDIKAGMEFSDKAFLSTTSTQGGALGYGSFGGVMFEIETHEGQHGLDVSKHTRNPQEGEVLLPRDTKLTVQSIIAPKKVGDPVRIKVKTVPGNA